MKSKRLFRAVPPALALSLVAFFSLPAFAADSKPVSFFKDIAPIFTASCNGCHQPEKKKGGLDMTSHAALMKGAKDGPALVPGDPKKSALVQAISGPEPAMPEKGDKLTAVQVELISRWIAEGAEDDTPAIAAAPDAKGGTPGPKPIDSPPVYSATPVLTSLAYSPDGKLLALSGYHEVLLYSSDGATLVSRLLSGSSRIESLAFSKDGKSLASSGGEPALFGHVQVWDVESKKQIANYKTARDTLFGISFSPEGDKVAFGCTDKSSRVLRVSDGAELVRLDQHTDWCLATLFTVDGKRLLTGGRDKGMKLTDLSRAQFIDDVNNPLESVLCIARHPKEDQVLYGGDMGTPRIYKISDNQGRTAARLDTNLLKTFEKQPGPCHAVAFSSDAQYVAIGSTGEVRVYDAKTATRVSACKGHSGAIFSIAFHPTERTLVTGGHDGKVRIFNIADGNLVKELVPVPVAQSVAGK